jgi:arylsulfatase
LYNLDADPGETTDVLPANAEVLTRLQQLAEKAREDLGDSAARRTGANVRPPGRLAE